MIGPLDELADKAFSMHMLQHMLLMKVIAPLLLLGEFSSVFLWTIGQDTAHQLVGSLETFTSAASVLATIDEPMDRVDAFRLVFVDLAYPCFLSSRVAK